MLVQVALMLNPFVLIWLSDEATTTPYHSFEFNFIVIQQIQNILFSELPQ
jgi:hypothetical protein